MRLFAVVFAALFSLAAQAQWGVGLSPGMGCNSPYGPAPGAISGNDELMNLSGQLAARNQRIAILKQKEKQLNQYINRAKSDIKSVLTSGAMRAIEEHWKFGRSRASYQPSCGKSSAASASAGTQRTDIELPNGSHIGGGYDDKNLPPPPQDFCIRDPRSGQVINTWDDVVEDDGTVSDKICDFYVPTVHHSRDPNNRDRCRDGMGEYYSRMQERDRLADEIAKLNREARNYETRLEHIKDEITEGTYCPWCAAQRRGYGNLGAGNSILPLIGVLGGLMNRPQPSPYPVGYSPYARPYGPPVMPYGGPGFPVNPYAARMPGYPFMMGPPGQAIYGAMPGAMGPGAFGCQGANPMAMGNPFASPGMMPFMGGNNSPFNNPFAGPQMMGMFNPGAGPGWGFPQYGNGLPGFQSPFGSPFGNAYGSPFANSFGPFGNPYGNGMYGNQFGSPYDPYSSPFAFNGGYGPNGFGAGGPFGNGFGNGYGNGYGYGGSPWGNPFAPAVLPYGGGGYGSPYGLGGPYGGGMPYGPGYGYPYGGGPTGAGYPYGGIPNYGYQSPWGYPLGSPVGSFYSQVDVLNRQMQAIQGGMYYGGGGLAPAPAILPYVGGPQPIYNTPGTVLNPVVPRPTPPPMVPPGAPPIH